MSSRRLVILFDNPRRYEKKHFKYFIGGLISVNFMVLNAVSYSIDNDNLFDNITTEEVGTKMFQYVLPGQRSR